MTIPNGTYFIEKTEVQVLTFQNNEEKSFVILIESDQTWIVEETSDGNYTIQNKGDGYFLAPVDKEIYENNHLVSKRDPFEWRIQPSSVPGRFHIVVPGGPVDGREFAVDLALELNIPPRIALRSLRYEDPSQAWFFRKVD
ncbi:hypothetical protein BDQ17DRAFT_1434836 [Cyathus striatus]|nr:hypothetical protein BDQ17DRAFT_1434836 [Cyathus striatus]